MRRLDLGPLAERDFRLLFAGQGISVLGTGVVRVALPFAVFEVTGSASALGLVLAAGSLPVVAFVLLGGVWADRVERRRLMLAADLVRAAAQGGSALLLVTGAAELWHLVALQALAGTAEAFFSPAAHGFVPQTVSPGRLQQANALLETATSASFVLGPAVGGILVATIGPAGTLALDAASYVVSAAFLAGIRPARDDRPASQSSFLAELAAGFAEVRSRTWLWVLRLEMTVVLFANVAPFLVLGPLVARDELGGASAWGAIATGFGAGLVVGGAVALRFRPRRTGVVLALAFVPHALAAALLAMPAPLAAIVTANALVGTSVGLFAVVWATTLQERIPPEARSRVAAWDTLGALAFLPLGYAAAGPVADVVGIPATLWGASAVAVLACLATVTVPAVRSLATDRAPRSPRPTTAPSR